MCIACVDYGMKKITRQDFQQIILDKPQEKHLQDILEDIDLIEALSGALPKQGE